MKCIKCKEIMKSTGTSMSYTDWHCFSCGSDYQNKKTKVEKIIININYKTFYVQ